MDVGEAATVRPSAELGEGIRTDVESIHAPLRTEEAGELEGFTAGAGAGVEPAAATGDIRARQD
jgi:hypothetical protein